MVKEHHIVCAHTGLIMTSGDTPPHTEHLSRDVLQGHRAHGAVCSTAARYAFKCATDLSLSIHTLVVTVAQLRPYAPPPKQVDDL